MFIFKLLKTKNSQTNTTILINKNKEKIGCKTKTIKHSFTGRALTKYSGLSPIMQYINKIKIGQELNAILPTVIESATKFSNVQIILSLLLAFLFL